MSCMVTSVASVIQQAFDARVCHSCCTKHSTPKENTAAHMHTEAAQAAAARLFCAEATFVVIEFYCTYPEIVVLMLQAITNLW